MSRQSLGCLHKFVCRTRGSFWQRARDLAPLDGYAGAIKVSQTVQHLGPISHVMAQIFYMNLVTRKPVFGVCDTVWLMRRLICTFVVHIWHKQVFSWCCSYLNQFFCQKILSFQMLFLNFHYKGWPKQCIDSFNFMTLWHNLSKILPNVLVGMVI